MELLEQLGAPGEEPRLHHGGTHGQIGQPQFHAILNRPYAVPDLKSAVPQGMEHLLHQVGHRLGRVRMEQEHEIDVRMGRQFPAPIAPQRDQATMVKPDRREAFTAGSRRGAIPSDDQPVDKVGGGVHHFIAGGSSQQALLNRLPLFGKKVGRQQRSRFMQQGRPRIQRVRHGYRALSPVSPVRIRTADVRSRTKILPSPMLPVFAARVIVSRTR